MANTQNPQKTLEQLNKKINEQTYTTSVCFVGVGGSGKSSFVNTLITSLQNPPEQLTDRSPVGFGVWRTTLDDFEYVYKPHNSTINDPNYYSKLVLRDTKGKPSLEMISENVMEICSKCSTFAMVVSPDIIRGLNDKSSETIADMNRFRQVLEKQKKNNLTVIVTHADQLQKNKEAQQQVEAFEQLCQKHLNINDKSIWLVDNTVDHKTRTLSEEQVSQRRMIVNELYDRALTYQQRYGGWRLPEVACTIQ